jgi:excisionase family DNA binding protein
MIEASDTTQTVAPKRRRGRPKGAKNRSRDLRLDAKLGLADTIQEFCARMKCSRAQAYVLMQTGKVRFIQFGRQRRIPHTEYVRLGVVS